MDTQPEFFLRVLYVTNSFKRPVKPTGLLATLRLANLRASTHQGPYNRSQSLDYTNFILNNVDAVVGYAVGEVKKTTLESLKNEAKAIK